MLVAPESLPLLMTLKPLLPERLWHPLRQRYWRHFWEREAQEEERSRGIPSTLPIAGSERAVLAEAIGDSFPFSTLLEFGCGYGQNFFTIAKQYPRAELVGFDINGQQVREGMNLLHTHGLRHVTLVEADAKNIERFSDNTFDLGICCGFMLYLGPDIIEQVCREMLRVCRRRILLMEQHVSGLPVAQEILGLQVRDEPRGFEYWIRDYEKLFAHVSPKSRTTATKVPYPRWIVERWQEDGHLITVDIAN